MTHYQCDDCNITCDFKSLRRVRKEVPYKAFGLTFSSVHYVDVCPHCGSEMIYAKRQSGTG